MKTQFSSTAIESRDGGLLLPIRQDNLSGNFLFDTGAVAGVVYQDVVDAAGLKTEITRGGMVGASGAELNKRVLIGRKVFGNVVLANEFFVIDRPAGGDLREAGGIGTNFFGFWNADLEVDFPGRKIAFYSKDHCDGDVVYWADEYLTVPMILDSHERAYITVNLDGQPIRALIDTGASNSSISLSAARDRFGLRPGGSGVEKAGITLDIDNAAMDTYRHQFGKLDIGGITFNNTWLDLTDMERQPGVDMILGRYHLRKLHMYFAYSERKLYITLGTGKAAADADSFDSMDWRRCFALRGEGPDTAISGCSTIISAGTQPKDHLAVAYARRGEAYAAKGDQASAKRDFDTAFSTDPGSTDVLTIHARSLAANGASDAALSDLDKAVTAAPQRLDALVARAQAEIALGTYPAAAKDLDHAVEMNHQFSQTAAGANGTAKSFYQQMLAMAGTISTAQPNLAQAHIIQADIDYYLRGDFHDQAAGDRIMPELDRAIADDPGAADAYLRRGVRYHVDRRDLDHAAADLDQYLRLRPGSVDGLIERCTIRALAGRLDDALADCDAAVKAGPTAGTYARRGFVHYKAQRFDQAVADFDKALQLNAKYAFALYGRGLARKAAGDSANGEADIAAAKKMRSDLDRTFYE